MISFTDHAKERVLGFLEAQRANGVTALRIAGTRAEQRLWLVKDEDKRDTDRISEEHGFTVYVDRISSGQLDGATVDFIDGAGFKLSFDGPTWDDPVEQKVQDVLDGQINPGVAAHSGNVSLEGVQDGKAYIRFGGGCHGCASADLTLKQGVERILKQLVTEITDVVDVTDHATGENPYYKKRTANASSPLA